MRSVTLDALIPREDFEINENAIGGISRNKTTLSIEDLKYDSFFFGALRKPDFQRETNEWDPDKVFSLIESFLNGELVPAIILWKNENGFIFVIDGAHRLSSLGAWINDDYGDGEISRKYYDKFIPEEQRKIAEQTRKLINEGIGSFKEIFNSRRSVHGISEEKLRIANHLGSLALQVQWVEGDSGSAEDSFLKINQSATKISGAELELIKSRNQAHAIAARAIVRAGKGHKYWSIFDSNEQERIQELSNHIHSLLFGDRVFTMDNINDLPIGGSISSNFTLDVVTQTVKICNGITKKENVEEATGKAVIKLLKRTLNIIERIHSKKPFSLGLHPFIYFYSDIGKHKVGSYYGMLELIKILEKNNLFNEFISARGVFEDTIREYSFLIQQIIRKNRQSKRGVKELAHFYLSIINLINKKNFSSPKDIVLEIKRMDDFKFLQIDIVDNEKNKMKENFSRGKKQIIKINTLVKSIPRCPICNGYLSPVSSSVDHIQRKREGGTGNIGNGQLTHLYCNTTYKN
ncbi:HNH endonuclease family protein [Sporolactobacillus shoreicorticis]|uniref:HNH endonuclease family protein n=2 Tax=Sporolactobacillus shoreicorticis TaxID=1923877 RepID=A0ABW5S2M5_9BACL